MNNSLANTLNALVMCLSLLHPQTAGIMMTVLSSISRLTWDSSLKVALLHAECLLPRAAAAAAAGTSGGDFLSSVIQRQRPRAKIRPQVWRPRKMKLLVVFLIFFIISANRKMIPFIKQQRSGSLFQPGVWKEEVQRSAVTVRQSKHSEIIEIIDHKLNLLHLIQVSMLWFFFLIVIKNKTMLFIWQTSKLNCCCCY